MNIPGYRFAVNETVSLYGLLQGHNIKKESAVPF